MTKQPWRKCLVDYHRNKLDDTVCKLEDHAIHTKRVLEQGNSLCKYDDRQPAVSS